MVNGRTNISMKTNYLMLMNIPVLLLHICQGGGGGQSHFKWVPIYVDGFEKYALTRTQRYHFQQVLSQKITLF